MGTEQLPEPILIKAQFVREYEQGTFGNRSPTWHTLEEFLRADIEGQQLVHIRNRVASAPTWYNIPAIQVQSKVERLLEEGYKERQLYYSLMAPTDKTLFQGEVQQSCNHLDLYYSKVPKPMRASLVEGGTQISGLCAKLLLEYYLDSASLEQVDLLLSHFPGHVIEFSTYSVKWGMLNLNTVIWEVRRY